MGVGISGREGLQAVNSSDFAIAQFRFLLPLLLIHGRWSYRRMAKVFLYSFFKNVVITFTLFYFNIFTGWSGTSLYDSLVYSGFNFFLGLPIIGVGIFDRCVAGGGVRGPGDSPTPAVWVWCAARRVLPADNTALHMCAVSFSFRILTPHWSTAFGFYDCIFDVYSSGVEVVFAQLFLWGLHFSFSRHVDRLCGPVCVTVPCTYCVCALACPLPLQRHAKADDDA